ncbi:uncharacterized protein OCT59_005715 [Rhizophagus irregularis]|uniref:uncharacterized protein n=1 Tax=Rhizophagus irregularis TaxID=588596 RepID=UPI0033283FC6|nr:hypothetical protein OCT59_005715 [Rhizophagus irregularis]
MLNVVGFFFDNISTKSNNAYANSLSSEKFLMISENLSYIAISSGRIEYLIRDKSDGCIHISSPSNISSNISTSSSNPDTNILSLLNSESKAFKYAISKYHIISFTHSSMLSSNWPSIRLSNGKFLALLFRSIDSMAGFLDGLIFLTFFGLRWL